MSAWHGRGSLVVAVALSLGAMSCSPASETSTTAPIVTCADAPALPGWTVVSGVVGVQVTGDGVDANISAASVTATTGERRQAAEEQVALGHWSPGRADAIHVPGYVTYEQTLGGVRLFSLVNEVDDSHANCSVGDCRFFVVLNERGVSIDMETTADRAPALSDILRELEPAIGHVAQYCRLHSAP
jgi:hypothetical protein